MLNSTTSTYKALLFDLDNTLVDFSASEISGLDTVHAQYFKNHLSRGEFFQRYHTINKQLWHLMEHDQHDADYVRVARFKLLAQQINIPLNHEEVAHTYEHTLGEAADWYPGVKQTLLSLKQHYRLGIVTNGVMHVQQAKHDRLEIHKLCECYVISSTLGVAKPHKEIFATALRQLYLDPHEVLMIGDSLASDYQGALNAKLDFCWINPENQTLPLKYPKPKYMLRSVKELVEVL